MRLHRFYTKTPINSKKFDISDKELVHQWKSVFRYNVGSQVIIFDGSGVDYLCLISSLRNSGATLAVIQEMKKEGKVSHKNIWICLALIKKDNFELSVQKLTELGVTHIVPVVCERSEKKKINKERLEKIAIEASEQSGRGDIPFVHELSNFPKVLDSDLLPNNAIYLDGKGEPLSEKIKKDIRDLVVFVGPEGGWSDNETKEFSKHNIPAYSIGDQTLRAETAAIAISSLLLL